MKERYSYQEQNTIFSFFKYDSSEILDNIALCNQKYELSLLFHYPASLQFEARDICFFRDTNVETFHTQSIRHRNSISLIRCQHRYNRNSKFYLSSHYTSTTSREIFHKEEIKKRYLF